MVKKKKIKIVIWTDFSLKFTEGKVASHLQDQVQRGLPIFKEQDPYILYIAQINAS